MNAGLISSRYAHALLLFANEEQAAERIYQDAGALLETLQQQTGLSQCVETLSEPMRRFITLVIRNKRVNHLPFILRTYRAHYRKQNGITKARLFAAAETAALEEKLRRMLESEGYTKVDFKSEVDPDLIGGFVLQIEDRQLDASIATELRYIRKELEVKNRQAT